MLRATYSSEDIINILEKLHFESEFFGFIHLRENAENASIKQFCGETA